MYDFRDNYMTARFDTGFEKAPASFNTGAIHQQLLAF